MKTKSVSQIIHEAMGLCWCEPIETGNMTPIGKEFMCNKCSKLVTVCLEIDGKKEALRVDQNPNYLIHGPEWTEMVQWLYNRSWDQEFINFSWIESDGATCEGQYGLHLMYFKYPAMLATKLSEFITDREEEE